MPSWKHWWLNAWPHRWRLFWRVPKFLKACPEPFRGEVLEVGTGKGWTSRRILETFPQVELTAIDVDGDVIATFQHLSDTYGKRLCVRQADAAALPFDREEFDFVVAINLLRDLKGEQRAILRELLRVLRPGGLLGLSEAGATTIMVTPLWEEIKRHLSEEKCEVLYVSTRGGFDIWVRKEYAMRPPLTKSTL